MEDQALVEDQVILKNSKALTSKAGKEVGNDKGYHLNGNLAKLGSDGESEASPDCSLSPVEVDSLEGKAAFDETFYLLRFKKVTERRDTEKGKVFLSHFKYDCILCLINLKQSEQKGDHKVNLLLNQLEILFIKRET